jgi:outer membrane protein assembly factor BamB
MTPSHRSIKYSMSKKFLFLTAALFAVILLSGCTGGSVRGNTWPGLSAGNDVAYLADGGFVYAVNLKDGTELWRYPDKRSAQLLFYTTPYITSDGTIIVGSSGSNASLLAITPNGKEAWSYTGTKFHWVAAPLQIDNKLYAPNSDGNLYVFDLSDGQTNKQPVKVIELSNDLWSQPVTDGKILYLSALDHSLFAVDKDTYQVVWHEDLGAAITSAPLLASDGNLYLGSFASNLVRFNPASGNNEAVEKTTDWVWGTPGELEKNLYFGDLKGNFYSYNLETGKPNSNPIVLKPDNYDPASTKEDKTVNEANETGIIASPIVVNDALLVATESGAIYRVDKDGNIELWGGKAQQPGGKIYTTPVLAGNLVLVSPMNSGAFLYAYDLDGNQKWSFKPAN